MKPAVGGGGLVISRVS